MGRSGRSGTLAVSGARWAAVAVAFGPSLLGGAVGVVAWTIWPPELTPRVATTPAWLAGAALGAVLLVASAALERTLPSFRYVSRLTERALRRLALPGWLAGGLAFATSVGEELLFRGVLLGAIGLIPQAILFGLLHPAGRKGWSYPVFVAVVGLALGGLVIGTGRLGPAIAAHLVVNGVGLLRTGRSARRRR